MPDRPQEATSTRAGRLYDEFGPGLYRYGAMLLADALAAEDAIQQVFAALVRHKGTIENERHYLRRAVRNECFSMLRGRRRRATCRLPARLPHPCERVNFALTR
jgi:DNA-directed RNA polymerase specialized sigma24 family protein